MLAPTTIRTKTCFYLLKRANPVVQDNFEVYNIKTIEKTMRFARRRRVQKHHCLQEKSYARNFFIPTCTLFFFFFNSVGMTFLHDVQYTYHRLL